MSNQDENSASDESDEIGILEIGAGKNPHPCADITLDIRNDLEHIDYSGVDIGKDIWPFDDETVSAIVAYHVIEHIPPQQIGHVFREIDRVLIPDGALHVELPYSGTYAATTDPTHYGTGGTTAGIDRYFTGDLEEYWPELNWDVTAWAELEFPLFVRPSLRFNACVTDSMLAHELIKIPFVTGHVVFEATKRE